MTSETGLPAEDFTLRRKIEPQEFEVYFEPREMRRETCLLSEVRWGAGRRTWRETRRNTIRHAEINFIKKLTSEGRVGASTRCSITWFLSWSPCWQCARAIREFLGHHRSVTLFIYVARLYGHTDQRNRRGLRDLVNAGVPVRVMNDSEYCYCWRNFVNHPPGSEARWPRYPPAWTMLYGLELLCIILLSEKYLLREIRPLDRLSCHTRVDELHRISDYLLYLLVHNSLLRNGESSTLFKNFKKLPKSDDSF